jgi:hypothetical protein
MRVPGAFLLAAAVLSWAAPAHAEVQLRIENGLVSLKATNATAREILAEWARVGQTRIVNAERMPGGPITIELTGVSEEQALEIILRSAAGYVTAPRATAVANASRYDRILVMPTSSPTRPTPPPSPSPAGFAQPAQQPQFPPPFPPQVPPQFQGGQFPPQFPPQSPRQRPVNDDGDADGQDDPAPNVVPPNPGSNPLFGVSPPQRPPAQQQPSSPFGPRPTIGTPPAGVTVPGMVVPAPPQQQVPPGFPGQPQDP